MSTVVKSTDLAAIKRQAAAITRTANALDAKRSKRKTKPAVKKTVKKTTKKKGSKKK